METSKNSNTRSYKRKRNTRVVLSTQAPEESQQPIIPEKQPVPQQEQEQEKQEKKQPRRKRVTGRKPRMKRARSPKHSKTNTKRDDDDGYEAEEEQHQMGCHAYFKTIISQKMVHDLVPRLTPDQRQAVKDISFGSLLDIKMNLCEGMLVKYLLHNFDIYRCVLKLDNEELHLEENDVDSTLGLARGTKIVVEGLRNDTNGESKYEQLIKEWREHWGVTTGSPVLTALANGIVEKGDHGEMFKRDFMLLTISTLLKGNQTRQTNHKMFSLINVDEIRNFNWCSFTYNTLIQTVETWKNKPNILFNGPTTILVVTILV